MSKNPLRNRVIAVAATATLLAGVGATAAQARSDDVIRRGTCSAGATWKLKLGPRDGRIETEFEVDSNRVGQAWSVTLTQNGATVFHGTRTTAAPSGSFQVRKVLPNGAGTDTIVGTASFAGQTCRGAASL